MSSRRLREGARRRLPTRILPPPELARRIPPPLALYRGLFGELRALARGFHAAGDRGGVCGVAAVAATLGGRLLPRCPELWPVIAATLRTVAERGARVTVLPRPSVIPFRGVAQARQALAGVPGKHRQARSAVIPLHPRTRRRRSR